MDFDKLIIDLRRDEGLSLKPYLDTAMPPRITIGFGRNLSDVGISVAEADFLLTTDVIRASNTASMLVPKLHVMSDTRQRVITNMAFNMGYVRLSGFKKFLKALDDGNYDLAADEMVDSSWYHQIGTRSIRLVQEMRAGG